MRILTQLAAISLICLAPFGVRAEAGEGERIRPLRIELLDGKILAAAQLAGKPAAYLFWATWCPICRSELPGYQRLHDAYAAKGLRVIAVSLDDADSVARNFLKAHGFTLPATMRSDELRQAFGPITGTPTLFLIDRQGRLNLKHLGGIEFDELEARVRLLL